MHASCVEGEGCYGWVGVVYGGVVSAIVVRGCGMWDGGREGFAEGRWCCAAWVLL